MAYQRLRLRAHQVRMADAEIQERSVVFGGLEVNAEWPRSLLRI